MPKWEKIRMPSDEVIYESGNYRLIRVLDGAANPVICEMHPDENGHIRIYKPVLHSGRELTKLYVARLPGHEENAVIWWGLGKGYVLSINTSFIGYRPKRGKPRQIRIYGKPITELRVGDYSGAYSDVRIYKVLSAGSLVKAPEIGVLESMATITHDTESQLVHIAISGSKPEVNIGHNEIAVVAYGGRSLVDRILGRNRTMVEVIYNRNQIHRLEVNAGIEYVAEVLSRNMGEITKPREGSTVERANEIYEILRESLQQTEKQTH